MFRVLAAMCLLLAPATASASVFSFQGDEIFKQLCTDGTNDSANFFRVVWS